MTKRKGLGRGLDALLGGANRNNPSNKNAATTGETPIDSATMPVVNAGPQDGQMLDIPVEYLQRGKYQPRRDMQEEALQELAESIKTQGVMQPIVIRPIGDQRYEIIAGERRWRASQLAGLEKIPAIIRDVPDEAAIAMALIENIQREDLNVVEEAVALKRLQDEFNLTHQEVADAVGKSRTAVSNILRLLNLAKDVRTLLERGDLEMGHARCLLSLNEDQQRMLARQIVAKGLSVRQAEGLVRQTLENQQKTANTTARPNTDIVKLQEGLAEQIGVPVTVQHSAKGAGKLIFKYNNLDELDGILHHLNYRA
jgi:ParB family transcriptional regulator, chromosome partitioning protein